MNVPRMFFLGILSQPEGGVSDIYSPMQNHQGQEIIFETEIVSNPKQSWSYSSDESYVNVSRNKKVLI